MRHEFSGNEYLCPKGNKAGSGFSAILWPPPLKKKKTQTKTKWSLYVFFYTRLCCYVNAIVPPFDGRKIFSKGR